MKVYKVTRSNNTSAVVSDERFVITYKVGNWIKPKIGKIFCFDSKELALEFARQGDWPTHRVWKTEAKNISEAPERITLVSEFFKKFWLFGDSIEHVEEIPPPGTILAGEIKLIEEI